MRVLGLIPARGGSKGIPNKNIKLLGTKPLIAYTIETALKSKLITTVAVSSDSKKILKVSKELGVSELIKRPDDLSSDQSPTIETVIHALNYYSKKNIHFDAVCLLQPTSPFRKASFLDKAILKFKVEESDSLVSVLEVPNEFNPHWVFEEDEHSKLRISTGDETIISRRQDLPKSYFRDGMIYITKSKVILAQQSLYGKSISYIESEKSNYVNIDTEKDWVKAEKLLRF